MAILAKQRALTHRSYTYETLMGLPHLARDRCVQQLRSSVERSNFAALTLYIVYILIV